MKVFYAAIGETVARVSDAGGDDQEGRLYQLLDWLQNNYSEAIEWPELADRFALPLRTLHRQLKIRLG